MRADNLWGRFMVINMACPKCGGKASEYDTNKWACLQCQQKFLYAPPPPPPATNINTSVNIQGSGLFDLDTSKTCSPLPVFKRRSEVDQSYIVELRSINAVIANNEQSLTKTCTHGKVCRWVCVNSGILMVLSLIIGYISENIICGMIFWFSLLACSVSGVVWFGYNLSKRSRVAEIAKLHNQKNKHEERDQAVLVGHRGCCPLCGANLFQIEGKSNRPSGLQHCLQCGKQAFTVQGYTYPLKHH